MFIKNYLALFIGIQGDKRSRVGDMEVGQAKTIGFSIV